MANEPVSQWYRTGDAITSSSPSNDVIESARSRAEIVFAAIFDGTAGEKSLAQQIIDTLLGNIAGILPDLEQWVTDSIENFQQMVNQIADIFNGLIVTPINAAVQGVKDWFSDLLPSQLVTATNNAVSSVATDFGAVAANLIDVAATILGIQNTTVENSTAIAAINAANGGNGGSGVYFVDTFDRANSLSLGGDWTTVDPSSVDIQIVSNEVTAGTTNFGTAVAVCNTEALGDNMSVAAVIGSLLSGLFYDSAIHVRMNATATTWVYLNVFSGKVYLGRATRSGSTITYNDWVSVTSGVSISKGTQVELRAEGSTYRAYVGGTLVASYTDAAVTHPVGASYRSSGFKVQFAGAGRSAAITSWAMADITVPDTLGTTWNLYRSNTSGATATTWGVSGTALGSNTFDVQDRAANIVVDNLGLGRVKILKAGPYVVSAHAVTSSAAAQASVGLLGGSATGSMALIKVGQVGPDVDESYDDFTQTNTSTITAKTFGASWVVYCPANYYLQPCGWVQSGTDSVAVVGDAAGWKTNFSGALTG